MAQKGAHLQALQAGLFVRLAQRARPRRLAGLDRAAGDLYAHLGDRVACGVDVAKDEQVLAAGDIGDGAPAKGWLRER